MVRCFFALKNGIFNEGNAKNNVENDDFINGDAKNNTEFGKNNVVFAKNNVEIDDFNTYSTPC